MAFKNWRIDSFEFEYNGVNCIVLLTLLDGSEKIGNSYAKTKKQYLKASLELFKVENITESIKCHIDFYQCYFEDARAFYEFFGINSANNGGKIVFKNFADHLAGFIPKEKQVHKSNENQKKLIASRLEKDKSNHIYCYDVRRNGKREDGTQALRSSENSNKAELLRPFLFSKYQADAQLSFYFSDKPEDENSDEVIMRNVANRK